YDVENDGINDNAYLGRQSGSEDEESGDEDLTREHYVDVGKSALRAQQGIGELGPKYTGSRVSRKALYGDDISDGDSDGDTGSDGSDNVSKGSVGESDGESFGQLAADTSDEDGGSASESGSDAEPDSDSESDGDNESDANYEMSAVGGEKGAAASQGRIRDEIKRLAEGEKALLSSITQTARGDVEKGKHVLNQTRMWEGSLDARIRVQKMMTAANELPQPDQFDALVEERYAGMDASGEECAEGADRLEKARHSVRGLLKSLTALRKSLIAQNPAAGKAQAVAQAQPGSKRKAATEDGDDGIACIWEELDGMHADFKPFRDESLERWGNKVQVSANAATLKKFKAVNQGIMHQISQTLADGERLVERTRLKRVDYKIIGKGDDADDSDGDKAMREEALATVDAHLKKTDPEIFDDTDFYQQLLRELIESRMVDSNDPMGSLGVRWAAVNQRSDTKKRNVDTKASKGRKIRYHVMEKLQNFMPPIAAGTWHEDMVNELFSSLLGQRVPKSILDADMDEQGTAATQASTRAGPLAEVGAADGGAQGLRLFG
ncbi:rRNA-processing protein bfr2, partial [Coemansia biformis]